jgi:hypothetical protein
VFDRGTLTKPSQDRQRDWLENSRFRSGDIIGMLCDMDKRTLSFYKNGEIMQDQGGHYQDGIFLNVGSAENFPDGFWPVKSVANMLTSCPGPAARLSYMFALEFGLAFLKI